MSILEVLVVMVVAMIVFGPNQLPELSKKLAKLYRLTQQLKSKALEIIAKQQAELQLEENLKKAKQAESKNPTL